MLVLCLASLTPALYPSPTRCLLGLCPDTPCHLLFAGRCRVVSGILFSPTYPSPTVSPRLTVLPRPFPCVRQSSLTSGSPLHPTLPWVKCPESHSTATGRRACSPRHPKSALQALSNSSAATCNDHPASAVLRHWSAPVPQPPWALTPSGVVACGHPRLRWPRWSPQPATPSTSRRPVRG